MANDIPVQSHTKETESMVAETLEMCKSLKGKNREWYVATTESNILLRPCTRQVLQTVASMICTGDLQFYLFNFATVKPQQ